MAKLVVSRDGAVVGHYFLDKDRFTIGRKAGNDIQLDEQGVSKEHAAILTVGNDQVLEDSGSTNGTLLNGAKVERHILQNNDVLEIGGFQLKYVSQRASRDMDFDKTLIIAPQPEFHGVPGERAEEQAGSRLATALSAARSVKATFPLGGVKGVKGPHAGREVALNRALKTFGRPGERVAVITRRPHGYYVTHVEGKKYPRVNGKSIGTQPHPLQEGDLIELGDDKLIFFLK